MHSNCTCSWLTKQQTSPATLCIASFSRFGCVVAVRQPKAQRPAFHLRKDVKTWLRENGKLFREKGIIDKWAKDSPMSARKIEDAGTCAHCRKKELLNFCNCYPLNATCPRAYAHIWGMSTRALLWRVTWRTSTNVFQMCRASTHWIGDAVDCPTFWRSITLYN